MENQVVQDQSKVHVLEENFIHQEDQIQEETDLDDENAVGIRCLRPLYDVYDKCNLAFNDLAMIEEASHWNEWKDVMQVEISMINKNKTWKLKSKPPEKMQLVNLEKKELDVSAKLPKRSVGQ